MGYALNFSAVWRSFDLLLEVWRKPRTCACGDPRRLYRAFVAFALVSKAAFFAARRDLCDDHPEHANPGPGALPSSPCRSSVFGSKINFIVTLAVYSGAYLAEVFRGGLLSVAPGLREAGLAIGLTEAQIRTSITMPIMIRNVLPSLSSTFISLFKDTSLAAAIAVPELTFEARKINVETFRVIETWMVTSGLYVVTCSLLAALLRLAGRRLSIPR